MFTPMDASGSVNLQATISSATASHNGEMVLPHHPITCSAGLYFDEEGVMSCDHAKTEKGEYRTQAACNHSLAILLIELASKL